MVKTFTITSDHATKGVKKSPRTCPVALALHDAGYEDTHVQPSYVLLTVGRAKDGFAWRRRFYNSPALTVWINRFDQGTYNVPAEFEVPTSEKPLF